MPEFLEEWNKWIAHFLKADKYAKRVGVGGPVYLATVLEYLATEVLKLARNAARDNKKNKIVPRHIQLAMRNDEELRKLLGSVTIGFVQDLRENITMSFDGGCGRCKAKSSKSISRSQKAGLQFPMGRIWQDELSHETYWKCMRTNHDQGCIIEYLEEANVMESKDGVVSVPKVFTGHQEAVQERDLKFLLAMLCTGSKGDEITQEIERETAVLEEALLVVLLNGLREESPYAKISLYLYTFEEGCKFQVVKESDMRAILYESIEDACQLFDEMPEWDVVTWNVIFAREKKIGKRPPTELQKKIGRRPPTIITFDRAKATTNNRVCQQQQIFM
eukprot:Gb_04913 [translate_table: standard]